MLKGVQGVRLDNRKVLCAPEPTRNHLILLLKTIGFAFVKHNKDFEKCKQTLF